MCLWLAGIRLSLGERFSFRLANTGPHQASGIAAHLQSTWVPMAG